MYKLQRQEDNIYFHEPSQQNTCYRWSPGLRRTASSCGWGRGRGAGGRRTPGWCTTGSGWWPGVSRGSIISQFEYNSPLQGWGLTRSPSSGVSTTPTAASPPTRATGRRRRRGAATSQHQTAGPGQCSQWGYMDGGLNSLF